MNEDAENWANLHKSGSTRSAFKIHLALLRSHSPEQRAFDRRSVQERVRPQEHGGVGQQCHAPSQSQAVEKHRAQAELIFLVRLSRLNPRADLLQQSLGGQRAERQQSQQGFVNRGCVGELPRAAAGLPATRAQLCRWQWPKPMQIVPHIVAEPLQRLALLTSCLSLADEGRHQFHVGAQMRHDSHAPAFPTQAFALGRQVAHVGDHLARPPRPALITIMETGHEQTALGNIGGRNPTDQWHEQDRRPILTPPQPEAVLFVADEPTALAGLERAPTQCRVSGRVSAGVFFLKPLHAAGRSVASMSAVAFSQRAAVWINGCRIASLIRRSPITPRWKRNALRMRTSGTRWRWRSRAKPRQARCSGSIAVSRLSECTGVSSANKCTRQSWAALNRQRGPRTGRALQCWLMKSSGTYGSKMSSKRLVPVTGRFFMQPKATHLQTMRLAFVDSPNFWFHQPTIQ